MEVLEEAFDDDIKTDAKISPWEVTSLYQFQFFCCPQCVFQVNVFQVNRSVLLVQQKNKCVFSSLIHHLFVVVFVLLQ